VKEQSHKDEMSAAVRGDFARLRDRGVAATLAPPAADSTTSAPEPMPAAPVPPAPEPAAAEPPPPAPVAITEPEAEPADEPPAPDPLTTADPEPDVERDGEPARAGGWLDRLLGR